MKLHLFRDKKFYLILLWLVFTTVFAIWWMVLGLGHVEKLAELLPSQEAQWTSQRRMLLWEGSAWITLLVIGGITSLYLLMREKQHLESLRNFFAAFNHDVKTSLASLRLQAESLKEDLEEQESAPETLNRLISDTMRLQVQLENSLYMSAKDSQKLLLEKVSFKEIVSSARLRWPQVQIEVKGDAFIEVDERAITTVINNLIQNAIVHGAATRVSFEISSSSPGKIECHFFDDGQGFYGDRERLGQLFFRPTTKSGTGMGLFICNELLSRMGGNFLITASESTGFSGVFVLKGDFK